MSLLHRLVESRLPSFDGATGWLNSAPLATEDLRGKVVKPTGSETCGGAWPDASA